ncbi:MAG: HRDC domain-containing protein [Actinobacteria bacterium]|nr:HRDC domain-containing protein [Actinomycetota bacterium]
MRTELVEDPARVTSALRQVDEPTVGVDVERGDGERYFRAAALVQVGVEDRCVLVDAVRIPDLGDLSRFLAGRLAVFHAIENDVEPLESAGVRLDQVADTQVAAQMLGLPFGLSSLLEELLDVTLTEDKSRLQRADWEARPLTDEMIAYAAGDVIHLPHLWDVLQRQLKAAGRTAWYEQELEATLEHARIDTRSWDRTSGLGRLDGHGRAILRAVWEERERIARDEDVAPQRIARDDALVDIAETDPGSRGGLADHLRGRQVREWGGALLAAAKAGSSRPDEPRPSEHRPPTDEDRSAYERMRKERARIAEEIGMDPGVLCPSRVLWPAVLSDPHGPDELCEAAGLRPWQREVLGDRLWDALRDEGPPDA